MKWVLAVLLAASCRTPPLDPVEATVDAAVAVDAAGACPLDEPKPHTACSGALTCTYSHEQSCDMLTCKDGVWLLSSDHCTGGI